MSRRYDEIDRRIIYHLMGDARNTTAQAVAEEMNVSAATIRNRLAQLESDDVITGYHAEVDFERVDGRLTNVFVCTAPVPERDSLARQALTIPGVIDARTMMAGQRNVHLTAVGENMDDVTRVAHALANLGLEIEEENLLENHHTHPYEPFGPTDERRTQVMADFMNLAGGAELVEFSIAEDAPLAGTTIQDASESDLIDDDILVVAVERDDEMLTPKGHTVFRPDDVVTIFVRNGTDEADLERLTGERGPDESTPSADT